MKDFFKENIALVTGIALPLILIVLFFAAGQISQKTVPDPQYDMVFALDYNKNAYNNLFDISVNNGNIEIKTRDLGKDVRPNHQTPRVYIFNHQTLRAELVDIGFDQDAKTITSPALRELNKNRIDPTQESPDGYKFDYNYRRHGGIFGEFFGFGYRDHSRYALSKNGRSIPVKEDERYYNAHFIGWVRPHE